MPRLLLLNGPPGIGKSTIARRYAEEHPGTLDCDIDVLRTLIGGWSHDFLAAGSLIRPAALALINAYLSSGHDVVLPQFFLDPSEIARFEACAVQTNAEFIERVLMDESEQAVARFARRGESDQDNPWHAQVQEIVAAEGGGAALREHCRSLQSLIGGGPEAIVVRSVDGDVAGTYRRLLESLS